jgi:hypothetical protein
LFIWPPVPRDQERLILIHKETEVSSGLFLINFSLKVQRKWERTLWLGKSDKLKEEREDVG